MIDNYYLNAPQRCIDITSIEPLDDNTGYTAYTDKLPLWIFSPALERDSIHRQRRLQVRCKILAGHCHKGFQQLKGKLQAQFMAVPALQPQKALPGAVTTADLEYEWKSRANSVHRL